MKEINTYITEKLIIDKDTKDPLNFEERYSKGNKVLLVYLNDMMEHYNFYFEAGEIMGHSFEKIRIRFLTKYHKSNKTTIDVFDYNDNDLTKSNDGNDDLYIVSVFSKDNMVIIIDQYNADKEILKNKDTKECHNSIEEINQLRKLFKDA